MLEQFDFVQIGLMSYFPALPISSISSSQTDSCIATRKVPSVSSSVFPNNVLGCKKYFSTMPLPWKKRGFITMFGKCTLMLALILKAIFE